MKVSLQRFCLRRSISAVAIFGCVLFLNPLLNPLQATVRRNDISDNVVLQLARQQQFLGAGTINNGGGSGVAIAPGWVLTVAHVAQTSQVSSFRIGNDSYFGTPIIHPEADIALIRLGSNFQLPSSTPFVAPNSSFNPINNLVWKSGSGRFGTRRDSNNGSLGPSGGDQRAGSNIVTGRVSQNAATGIGPTDLLTFARPGTAFEVTTAPGDSGGPMFLQVNNQWVISGVTNGIIPGVGFVDTDVASYHQWIEEQTGLTFEPSSGPTELLFDTDFTTPGVQSGLLPEFAAVWDNERPFFTGGDEGYNFTWENDFAPTAVFGTSGSDAAEVQVQSDVSYGGIRFDRTAEPGGSARFQLTDGGGSLRAIAGGSTIEVNQDAVISGSLVGNSDQGITKTGSGELVLSGNNGGFNAAITINEGTLTVGSATALGTDGATDFEKTTVGAGGTLHLTGPNLLLNESIEIAGQGSGGDGAVNVSSGQHTFARRVVVGADSKIEVAQDASLTFAGAVAGESGLNIDSGQLTQSGGGTVFYEGINALAVLEIDQGVAAIDTGEFGTVTIGDGGELRPGDTSAGEGLGVVGALDFSLLEGGLLTLDVNAFDNDFIGVDGDLFIAGDLQVNFEQAPRIGDSFSLITTLDPRFVEGEFANIIANVGGNLFMDESLRLLIDYAGGSTGSEVVLLAAAAVPEPSCIVLLGLLGTVINCRRRRSITGLAS